MSKLFIEDTSLTAIGDAIREKTGKEDLIKLGDMPAEIASITTGGGEADYSGEDGLVTRSITEYSNDRVKTVGVNAFYGYSNLKSVNLPNVTSTLQNAFQNCSGLINVNLPKLITMGSYTFRQCSALVEIVLPSVKSVNGLRGCSKLEKLDISSAEDLSTDTHTITSSGLYSDVNSLHTIIIRYTKGLFTLGAALPNCPIKNGEGYIYVPKALIEDYKVATNWVTYAEQFRAIEDYPEICGGAE